MSKTLDQAISELMQDIDPAQAELDKKKETVNTLCGLAGRPPAYVITARAEAAQQAFTFRSDEFYGEPLASSARRVLEQSRAAGGGAISLDALYDALKAGGFLFDAKNDKFARRSLAISLSKNTQTFVRLPNGDYGLRSWYKKAPRRSGAGSDAGDEADDVIALDPDEVPGLREAIDNANQDSGPALLEAPAGPAEPSETEDRDYW